MSKERLLNIDAAKGLAIILVVIGHFITQVPLEGNDWFKFIHRCIYRFHMPLFMFLSGVVYYYKFRIISGVSEYIQFIKQKAFRLMPGFIIFGLIILLGKFALSLFIYVDDKPDNLLHSILNLIINPYISPAGSLWYIYVLFEFYMFFTFFNNIIRNNTKILIIFSIILNFLTIIYNFPKLFALNLFCEYLFYFNLGQLYVFQKEKIEVLINSNNSFLFIILFVFSFITMNILPGQINKVIISIFSIPAAFVIIKYSLNIKKIFNYFLHLGEYTFTIYLMNTIFIGLAKGILFKFFSWNGINFFIYLPILLLSGLILPIVTYEKLFSKSRFLARITK